MDELQEHDQQQLQQLHFQQLQELHEQGIEMGEELQQMEVEEEQWQQEGDYTGEQLSEQMGNVDEMNSHMFQCTEAPITQDYVEVNTLPAHYVETSAEAESDMPNEDGSEMAAADDGANSGFPQHLKESECNEPPQTTCDPCEPKTQCGGQCAAFADNGSCRTNDLEVKSIESEKVTSAELASGSQHLVNNGTDEHGHEVAEDEV
ncbi:hypothetical protein LSH36_527g01012 [Paralvinella palmiformis]|uniref:Uncharacterized protein n=1 Tax=Paralvinella palmiformis TaxID=53620 RepID=A0AAD9J7U6_9ANNE|nr:hypothetical protein LSH36_527g01012 [Paralvinella palmiformis]